MKSTLKNLLIFLRQFSIVSCAFFVLLLFFQYSLNNVKDSTSIIHISGTGAEGDWDYTVSPFLDIVNTTGLSDGMTRMEHYQQFLSSITTSTKDSTINVQDLVDTDKSFTLTVVGASRYMLQGKNVSLIEASEAIAHLADAASLMPARQVTVKDVIDAQIPTPVQSKVSFPQFSYADAFPDATDRATYTIKHFQQSPDLLKRTQLLPGDAQFLPVVEERLPRNPAVVKGPDGVGVYGGDWRQCTSRYSHINRQIGGESFTRHDPSGNIQPGLAYKWTESADLKTFTFYLRKGHKWSDGSPFTARDITWVLNEDIGSQRWPSAPDWMQETDGSKSFNVVDIKDWTRLLAMLNSDSALAAHLRATATTLKLNDFTQALDSTNPDITTQTLLVQGLNTLAGYETLYDDTSATTIWAQLDTTRDLAALNARSYSTLSTRDRAIRENILTRNALFVRHLAHDETLKNSQIQALQSMLIKSIFPTIFHQPYKSRVVVTPIADADGDDSHIIRFTFPRPNPLFVERTTTWMFYRGLFEMQRAYYAPYSYVGSHKISTFDIMDWKAYTNVLANAPTGANKQLWQLLTAAEKEMITSYVGVEDDSSNNTTAEKEKIIHALNRALTSKTFYKKTLWDNSAIDTRLQPLLDTDVSTFAAADWNRYREASSLQSLRQRVHSDGIDSLNDHDIYLFNSMMYRLSFASDSTVVASNREQALNENAKQQPARYRSWPIRCRSFGKYHPLRNPHKPTLSAWRVVSTDLEVEIKAIRNPYYYRVDTVGNQLPYLDRIVVKIEKQSNVRLLAMTSGNVDFQTRDINTQDWSVLKSKELAGNYRLRRWANDYCGEFNLYTMQTNTDPDLAPIIADKRFRYALSHALNRQEMIDVIWQGAGTPSQRAVPEGSPFHNPQHNAFHIEYDIDKANALLDELGLDKRTSDGTRLLPNGKPVVLNIYSSHQPFEGVIQMACSYFRAVGINARMKLATRSAINRHISSGVLELGAVNEGDSYFGPLAPNNYAPSHPAENAQWYAWSLWYYSKGTGGTEPPQHFKDRKAQWDRVVYAPDRATMLREWQALSELTRIELPFIGVTTSPGQVVYVKNGFKNVPRLAIAGWIAHQPSNCCPEAFYKVKEAP